MDVLNIIFGIITILGAGAGIYFGVKSKYLERLRYRFSWPDIHTGIGMIAKRGINRFKPDIVVSFSGPAGAVANLAMTEAKQFLPFYCLMILDKDNDVFSFTPDDCFAIETTKWKIFVPNDLLRRPACKVLIIDDCTVSGDTIQAVTQLLINRGFQKGRILTCTVICSQIAVNTAKAPDFCCYVVDHATFYVPWGKAF